MQGTLPKATAVLKANDQAEGPTCAILTPAIKSKLKELDSGQVLQVEVRDPTAREDIEAWCRISGNPLLAMMEDGKGKLTFFVRKK